MIITRFKYRLWRSGSLLADEKEHTIINPKFSKLMELLGRAIKEGKQVNFTYKNNEISVRIK